DALEKIAYLEDPIGKISKGWVNYAGLKIEKISIPIGLISVIYVVQDFDRKLNKRGKEDLEKLFYNLKTHEIKFDFILSSPSKRTA
ncbi:hypothetical protein VWM73_11080, partial [Campylobacter coli]